MLHTPCYDWHVDNQGRMVDFAGWEMPIQYTSIIEEHNAVRNSAGIFDIAHMGRLKFTGADRVAFLDSMLTNDVTKVKPGQIRYSLVTNEAGGILDDVLIYNFDDFHLLVVNASNREKIVDWLNAHISKFDVTMEDETLSKFMLALQGPKAVGILNPLVTASLSEIDYYHGVASTLTDSHTSVLVTRTGYTGEDGFELICDSSVAADVWNQIMDAGEPRGLMPAGLGCRDTLRLEAAMPLYGHELSEEIDPLTAGLRFGVKLGAGDFVGKSALVEIANKPVQQKRVGLIFAGKRIAREHTKLFAGETEVGEVTSGTFSPTLEKSVAMGYVKPDHADIGTELTAKIRGRHYPAHVVKLPFYKKD